VDARSSGVGCTLLKTLAGDKQCEVVFDNVKIPHQNLIRELGHGWDYIERVLPKITIAKCAEMLAVHSKYLRCLLAMPKKGCNLDALSVVSKLSSIIVLICQSMLIV
jgi:hypothetical protein